MKRLLGKLLLKLSHGYIGLSDTNRGIVWGRGNNTRVLTLDKQLYRVGISKKTGNTIYVTPLAFGGRYLGLSGSELKLVNISGDKMSALDIIHG